MLIQIREHVRQELAFKLDDVFGPVDETHFDVQRIVLGEVAAGGVRLGAVDVAGFIHALESSDAMLLVELRALRQICDTFKIFNLEEIGPSLCSASDNFG